MYSIIFVLQYSVFVYLKNLCFHVLMYWAKDLQGTIGRERQAYELQTKRRIYTRATIISRVTMVTCEDCSVIVVEDSEQRGVGKNPTVDRALRVLTVKNQRIIELR